MSREFRDLRDFREPQTSRQNAGEFSRRWRTLDNDLATRYRCKARCQKTLGAGVRSIKKLISTKHWIFEFTQDVPITSQKKHVLTQSQISFSRDSRKFRGLRDSRDSSSEKTPFVMTPFSCPEQPDSAEVGTWSVCSAVSRMPFLAISGSRKSSCRMRANTPTLKISALARQ